MSFHRGNDFTPFPWPLFSELGFNRRLARKRQWICHVCGRARLNVIRVGNHLLQIYNSLLIAFLTLNLTMTNDCISESFYRPLALPHLSCYAPPLPPDPNLFQRVAVTGPNVSHLTRPAANLACQYVSRLIHQLTLFISAVLLLSHFTTERLDFAPSPRSSAPPPLPHRFTLPPGPLLQGVNTMTITVLAKSECNKEKTNKKKKNRGSL